MKMIKMALYSTEVGSVKRAETKTFGMESHKTMGVRVSFCDFVLLKWLHRPFWSCFGILLYLVESFL